MLVEKKAFIRFLLIYILSSIFLLSVGIYLYYKMSHQLIINSHISHMKKNINTFIEVNQKKYFLHNKEEPKNLKTPIAIYINKSYKSGTFKLKNVENLTKEYFTRDSRLYYVHNEHKRWGEVFFVTFSDISKDIQSLQFNLLTFTLLSILFIVAIAYVLGKIFLKPMRDTIRSLENFIADATHEINTPISNILINIELSRELYPTIKDSDEFKKIESSVFRVSKIFKDLSFLRFQDHHAKNISQLKLENILLERLDFFTTLIENKSLQIDKNIEATRVEMDKEDLIRLIDNLLSNAIKYTKKGGMISIKLQSSSIEIINDGEIKDAKNVLKKFVRENKNEGGFGLGLHIIQKICNTYGFKFTLKSLNSKVISKIYF